MLGRYWERRRECQKCFTNPSLLRTFSEHLFEEGGADGALMSPFPQQRRSQSGRETGYTGVTRGVCTVLEVQRRGKTLYFLGASGKLHKGGSIKAEARETALYGATLRI